MNYTELHLHTHHSLLDGLNNPAEYMKRAKDLGQTHMAQTDHGTNAGHREFQRAAKEAGIKPILGQEMYISATDRFDRRSIKKRDDNTNVYNHLIVLAQDAEGLNNLNRLSEIAWTEGFYSKPRIDMEVLEQYNEGLIILSGCKGGLISAAIDAGHPNLADSYAREFQGVFGDRFFMEIQAHNGEELNNGLLEIARRHGIRPVVTSDCHHAREEDVWLEDAMLILSTKPDPSKDFSFAKSQKMPMLERFEYAYPERTMQFNKYGLWLHSAEEHLNSPHWKDYMDPAVIQEAIDNTMVVADMIGDYPYYEGLDLLPKPKTENPDELLWKKVIAGAKKRGTFGDPEADARRKEEMDIIIDKGFTPYFLIEANAVSWGKAKGIRFGPGRGSGVGSQVNYELGVTEIPPLEHNLLFFRFINPERNDFPDIDTDVEVHRRSEVKEYLRRQYKHVASIATFGTFAGKEAVRSAARVFRVPLGAVNRALKGADWPKDWFEEWERSDRGKEFIKQYPEVLKLAKFLQGRLRTQGMHAGGIVVSSEPISNYAPMQTAKDNSDESGNRIPLVAYDMEEAERVGFIKYDFLGLKALSIITDTLNLIKERTGKDIDLNALPLDDKRIYNTLSEGWTKGVFQCEANPYTNLIIEMGGVKNFNDLVASNALVRPGASKSSAGKRYIARNRGEEMIEFHHPLMQSFTKDTYGVVIYQEQVMLTMTELAGMPMSEADKVRKIIGKKRDVKEFEQYKQKFVDGASQHVPKKLAESLWHDFEAHAGYSFNKSHAVAYSMLSYWTAWLKEYYPMEFMVSVLSNEGDKDQLLEYLIETKRLGIRVMLPHINKSGVKFEIQSDERGEFVRFGLSNIKYISGKIGNRLVAKRPFSSYDELYKAVMEKGSGLSTRALQGLNAVGAAKFEDNPLTGQERENFFEYLNIPAFKSNDVPPKVKAQMRPLDEFAQEDTFVSMGMVRGIKTGVSASGTEWARVEIVDETGTIGVFTNPHTKIEPGQMYIFLISNNRVARYLSVDDFDPNEPNDFVHYLMAPSFPDVPDGMKRVVSFNTRITKKGHRMADIIFCDENKNLTSALVFPREFMKAYSKCQEGQVVDVVLNETEEGTLFVDNVL